MHLAIKRAISSANVLVATTDSLKDWRSPLAIRTILEGVLILVESEHIEADAASALMIKLINHICCDVTV
jgi:hypothetical protein